MRQFRAFERKYSLFDLKVDGIYIWERLRKSIWSQIRKQLDTGQAHTQLDLDTSDNIEGAKLLVKNIINKNPFNVKQHDYLFFGHQRRKKEPDSQWWDIYCDPIHEQCSFDYVHLEKPYLLEHRSPAKTGRLRYADLLIYSGTVQRKLGFHKVQLSQDAKSHCRKIEAGIQEAFGVEIDIVNRVTRLLSNRRSRLWLYEKLLERVDPGIVVVVVSYGEQKSLLIEACQKKGIPTVELQHGVIYPDHLAYNFSGDRTKRVFPDYLLVWGEFWKNNAEFPIPDKRVIPVGYPYLEQRRKLYTGNNSTDQLLFISQGTIGEQLSKFALEVHQHPEIDYDVVYKLHPGEYDRWREEYPWLVDANFEVIDQSDPPLYQLFAGSSAQIGVGSTAVYEGLAFDLETFVYDCSGRDVLQSLISDGAATLVQSADELAAKLGDGDVVFDREYYFKPNATRETCQVLQRLKDKGKPYNIR